MLLVTIITFILSCLLGLSAGILFLAVFFRAIISTVSVLVLGAVLRFIVKKFLPGILSKDIPSQTHLSTDNDLSFSDKNSEMTGFQDNKIGRKFDVRLDEESVSKHNNELLDHEESVNNNYYSLNQEIMEMPEVPLIKSNNRIKVDKDVFLETNPDVLVKMIRTSLSDED